MPKSLAPPTHVLEMGLYVKNKTESDAFYQGTLGLEPTLQTERMSVYALGSTTLILFQVGQTHDDIHPEEKAEYTIPGHGPTPTVVNLLKPGGGSEPADRLKQHFCLAVPVREDVLEWEEHLKSTGVEILGVVNWERGGRSVYFADPDGHVGELASRGLWPHY